MIVDKLYHRSVFYVVGEFVNSEGESSRHPIGTAFCVQQLTAGITAHHYCVTARHVIEGEGGGSDPINLFIRIGVADGFEDIAIRKEDWICHPETDIAVCIAPPRLHEYFSHGVFDRAFAEAGQDVFFIGLFSGAPGEHSVDAIVRFGRVCRERTKIQIPLGASHEIKELDAFLIEAHPWPGASGSPVFRDDNFAAVAQTLRAES